jgi:hypothetical protein
MSTGRRMFHNLRAYLRRTVSTACGSSMDLASGKVELMGSISPTSARWLRWPRSITPDDNEDIGPIVCVKVAPICAQCRVGSVCAVMSILTSLMQ